MSRKPLTVAELNSMQRITPTGYAEEGRQADIRRGRPMPIGPAGVPVPDPRALFRKGQDVPVLKDIARAAFAAFSAVCLPRSEVARAGALLRAALIERFPQTDMLVLQRYGFAQPHDRVSVEFRGPSPYEEKAVIRLDEAILSPGSQPSFNIGKPGDGVPPPGETLEFFMRTLALRRERKRFDDLVGFPSQFRVREGRWPRWFEIERQVPEVAQFLASQRRQISNAQEGLKP